MINNIILLTNHLTPYRKCFYDDLYNYCKLLNIKFTVLLMTKIEPRRNWEYEKLKSEYTILMKDIHFSFPINNHFNPSIIKYIKEIKPDILIMAGSYLYFTNWLVLLLKNKIKLPIYYWNEAHFNEKRKYNLCLLNIREYLRNIIFPQFDGYWYSGKMSLEFINHYARPNSKLHFVPNLIENKIYYKKSQELKFRQFELRNKWGLPQDNIIFIIPARLSWVKGIHTFIDLITKSPYKNNLTIIIPGVGEYENQIKEKINNSNIDIRLLGFQNQENIIELYSLSDVFVMPSLSDPNPLTCIEALWCGLPLFVSTHVGNYPEVIKEGLNGYVFSYEDEIDALKKIEALITADEHWKHNASKISIEIANEIYNPEKVIKKLINNLIIENK